MEQLPTVAPTATIHILGETRTLRYGFRAYQELGFNPMDATSVEAYVSKPKDARELAKQIWAGLLHEHYGRNAPRKGQEPPTIDDVMDELDAFSYVDIWVQVQKAMGVDRDEEKKPNPPEAGADPA